MTHPYKMPHETEADPPRVLEEEHDEAEARVTGSGIVMASAALAAVVIGGGAMVGPGASVVLGGLGAAFLVAAVAYYRARQTIRAWRDQKRRNGER